MSIILVSTYHKSADNLYGQKFVETFRQYVDKKIKLWLYLEGFDFELTTMDDHLITMSQEKTLNDLVKFKQRWKDVPKANGVCPFPERRPRDYHKTFKWDAIRFSNKVYAVFDAFKRTDAEWVVWIDADTVFHSKWTYDEFKELLPNDKWITYVGRGKGSQTWPECGFYGLNVKHPVCQEFMKNFEDYYNDAENGIFTLDEWHDSYVFGHLLEKFKLNDPNVYDYSDQLYNVAVKSGGGGHPLINGPLGKWIDHLKGDRKQNGHSNQNDLLIDRNESWWQ